MPVLTMGDYLRSISHITVYPDQLTDWWWEIARYRFHAASHVRSCARHRFRSELWLSLDADVLDAILAALSSEDCDLVRNARPFQADLE
jgi:hypothetical protein